MITNATSFLELMAGVNLASVVVKDFNNQILELISGDEIRKINKLGEVVVKSNHPILREPKVQRHLPRLKGMVEKYYNIQAFSILKMNSVKISEFSFSAALHCIFILILAAYEDYFTNIVIFHRFILFYCYIYILLRYSLSFEGRLTYIRILLTFWLSIVLGAFIVGIQLNNANKIIPAHAEGTTDIQEIFTIFLVLIIPIGHYLLYFLKTLVQRKSLKTLASNERFEEIIALFIQYLSKENKYDYINLKEYKWNKIYHSLNQAEQEKFGEDYWLYYDDWMPMPDRI